MWVKRTPAEIVEVRRGRRRNRIRSAVIFGFFMTLMTTFTRGAREAADRGSVLVPLGELLTRLSMTFVFGLVSGLVHYWFDQKKPTVVCSTCGTVRHAGDSSKCSCGGNLKNIEEMKWV